jgi:uncharacterized membrane protein
MIKNIKRYLIALVIVLTIDLTWILGIANSFYTQQLSGFARPETVPVWSALLAWALIPLGIAMFVIPAVKSKKQSLSYGAIFGLVLYGVYDFTNYATLANFTLIMTIADVIWGTVLCAISSLLIYLADRRWNK